MIFHPLLRASVLMVFLLVSCAEKKEVSTVKDTMPPDSLISREKMIHILADVHMIEAALMVDRNAVQESKDKPGFYYEGIFKKYHISRSKYEANMNYYSLDPSELVKMYDQVILEIENRQKKFPVKK